MARSLCARRRPVDIPRPLTGDVIPSSPSAVVDCSAPRRQHRRSRSRRIVAPTRSASARRFALEAFDEAVETQGGEEAAGVVELDAAGAEIAQLEGERKVVAQLR